MKIDNIKELQKVIQLCRKLGVEVLKTDGVELVLGPAPEGKAARKYHSTLPTKAVFAPGGITEDTKVLTDELSPDQMLFWSAQDPSAGQPEQ